MSTAAATPLIEARSLSRYFRIGGGLLRRSQVLRAVDDVDLDVERGQVLALVGESGSGKTTLGRCLLGMLQPTAGSVHFDGEDMAGADRDRRAGFRRRVQPIFQNPYSSLDPRWPVARTVREPLDAFGVGDRAARERRVTELLDSVGLSQRHAQSRPHELSGGQRQRVAIAAALALRPDLIVADEPVSALDVLVQAQILNLICDLQRDLGLTLVFITHDMAVVEHIADRVAVMYLGRIVESGPAADVLTRPKHPYTRTVLAAIPQPDPGRRRNAAVVRGEIPSPLAPPPGCHFHPRCPLAVDRCRTEAPAMTAFTEDHLASCHVTAQEHRPKGA
jgi:peptide/nickel transport system ATP-binding protein